MTAPKSTNASDRVPESETEIVPHGHPEQDPPKPAVKLPWMAVPVGIQSDIELLARRLDIGAKGLISGDVGIVSMGQMILVRSALRVAWAAWQRATERREPLS